MRLLNIETFKFQSFHETRRPKYVILSHRWVEDQEVTFQDVRDGMKTHFSGYKKIVQFAGYVKEQAPGIEWLWVDTCCINKENNAELSESLNLMFDWYHDAELCIAYLADVLGNGKKRNFDTYLADKEPCNIQESLTQSEWFRRGWTLQELLAPPTVIFVTGSWDLIGNKGASKNDSSARDVGNGLEGIIARITGIPEHVLHDYKTCNQFSSKTKMDWMTGRTTTRAEDKAYALFGILGVAPGANYGEKYEGAKHRLEMALEHKEGARRFQSIVDWLSPPDPWTNHNSARQLQEPGSGDWLLNSDPYGNWKTASDGILWLHGKAGCGKTVLCSTAIEDVKTYCGGRPNAGYAVFYFTFSDSRKQQLVDLLRSLVAQLGWKGSALPILQQAHDKPNRSALGLSELENMVLSCFNAYDEVFLFLDALDECPEEHDIRHRVFKWLESVLHGARPVKLLATSREIPDIETGMTKLHATSMPIATNSVNEDIRRYTVTQLEDDHRLSRLEQKTRQLIEETIAAKADGMFRWAYCQLQELKQLKSTKPSSVRKALCNLPQTLDETYERVLVRIPDDLHDDALAMLRLLAFCKEPPRLEELAEMTIIDWTGDGHVNTEDRPGLRDVLEILSGLVVVFDHEHWSRSTNYRRIVEQRVRLAHFSVQEYLESDRPLRSDARPFHLEKGREHKILAHCCLIYLHYYSGSPEKLSTSEDAQTFPLLKYAATSWYYHSPLQQPSEIAREIRFLSDQDVVQDWLTVEYVDHGTGGFGHVEHPVRSGLYLTSLLGLETIVAELLRSKADLDAQGGWYDYALPAACANGHERVVQMLLDAGASMTAELRYHGNALQIACEGGYERIVEILLDAGADVTAEEDTYDVESHGTALQAASYKGNDRIVHMLLDAGADVNVEGGQLGSALQAACLQDNERIVHVLLDAGADVNATGGEYGTALQAASCHGDERVLHTLLDAGADVNAMGGGYGYALQAACWANNEPAVRILLDAGADVNAKTVYGDQYGHALQAACVDGFAGGFEGRDQLVRILLDAGADVNAEGGEYGYALQAVCVDEFVSGRLDGRDQIFRTLLDAGADVNATGGQYGTALQAASRSGFVSLVQTLLGAGADVNITGGACGNALLAATLKRHEATVRLLIAAGANIHAVVHMFDSGSHEWIDGDALTIVTMELQRCQDSLEEAKGGECRYRRRREIRRTSNEKMVAKEKAFKRIIRLLVEAGAILTHGDHSNSDGLDDSNNCASQNQAGDDLDLPRMFSLDGQALPIMPIPPVIPGMKWIEEQMNLDKITRHPADVS